MNLADLWDKLLKQRTRSTVTRDLAQEGAVPVESEAGYFQLRVADMYLEYERELWQKLAPATLCVCDFQYGSKPVRVPFFVSNQMLAGANTGAGALDKVRIRLRDTPVLGPVPYRGGSVGVFAGLYRTVIEDERKALFSVFDKLLGACCASALGSYVQLAEKISDELSTLLGMKEVKCVVAERNVFGQGARPLRSGWLAMLDADEARLAGVQLKVVDGALHRVEGEGSRAFDLCNYCLLRIETSETRDDVTTLPFHRKWKEAQAKLLRQQLPEAKAALIECQAMLLESEDLTEDHKNRLVEFYQAAFLKDQKRFEAMGVAPIVTAGQRGAGPRGGVAVQVQMLADLARQKPRLGDSLGRIQRLVADAPLPVDASDQDGWEAAIQAHLAGTVHRKEAGSAQVLAHTLAAAMMAN